MKKFPIALQLYSIRDELMNDFCGNIKKIKEQGYDGVELAGCYGLSKEKIKSCLNENQLVALSAHVPIEELAERLDETLDYYGYLGCKYIAVPYLQEKQRYKTPAYEGILETIRTAGNACKDHGIQLLYHNHDFEFEKTEQDSYVIDELYNEISSDLLKTEFDTCWVHVAGEDPVSYLEKYKERCPVIHLKDYEKKDQIALTHLGNGVMDFKKILEKAETCGVEWVVIEQDDHYGTNSIEDAKRSIDYLKAIMQEE